jgi:hypothetical protein
MAYRTTMPVPQQPKQQQLDPAVAWLILRRWGEGNHIKARHRTVKPLFEPIKHDASLLDRWLALVAPWHVHTYPPRRSVLTAICGVRGTGVIARWRREGVPPEQAERLARFLESRMVREQALVDELLAHAAARRAAKRPPWLVTASSEDRSAWWHVRRQKAAERRAKRERAARAAARVATRKT